MVIFGLILLLVGVVGLLSGIFGTDYDTVEGEDRLTTEFLGFNCGPEVIFLIGAVAGALIVLGLWLMKFGAQQGWRRRKEQKRLHELSDKLDRAEAQRRGDDPSLRDGDA